MTHSDDLTPQERQALQSLPRELEPPDAVRERVREELFLRGVLRRSGVRRGTGPGHAPLRRKLIRWAAAAAVLIGVFLAGMGVGSLRRGAPAEDVAEAPAVSASSILETDAIRIQAAGSDYAEAIQALADDSEVSPETLAPALATLRGAAEQLSRVPGLDPETVSLLLRLRKPDRHSAVREGML